MYTELDEVWEQGYSTVYGTLIQTRNFECSP